MIDTIRMFKNKYCNAMLWFIVDNQTDRETDRDRQTEQQSDLFVFMLVINIEKNQTNANSNFSHAKS